ncbi:MAG: signal peptidase I [Candidatus Kariarchaeaceae archaeon]|jgi:signal peptidase I
MFGLRVIEVIGDSMSPTLIPDSLILIKKIEYQNPYRGMIVTFDFKGKSHIKRVIGLPSEFVEVEEGMVRINDHSINERYLLRPRKGHGYNSWILDSDAYILLGDNGLKSRDSRKLGPISRELITHRVIGKIWPLGRLRQ